jgi:hypothetical protein
MPKWQFLIVKHFGGPLQRQQTCARIKQQVEQHGLSDILPLVKYERGRQREYYLGIAIDANVRADGREAADVARNVLADAGVSIARNPQFSYVVEADEVQRLLTGTLECDSFTIPITYDIAGDTDGPSADQLFAEVDAADLLRAEPSPDDTRRHSRLLEWCSAVGSGELVRIQQSCQALGFPSEWGGAWSILRRLVLLGHLEFAGDSLRWGVIPPTLITPDDDAECMILVGQRTPGIINFLRSGFHLEEQPQIDGPPRVVIDGAAGEIFYGPGRRVHEAGCAARELSNLLPHVNDWVSRLPTWDEQDFGRFDIERYEPQFDQFHEVSTIDEQCKSCLYRFTFRQRRIVTLGFFDDRANRWICGDYYGLRFLSRARHGRCRAVFRTHTNQLLIPLTDRWPMPYERALVLASGALPQRIRTDQEDIVLSYQGITGPLAEKLSTLLDLELEAS